MAGSFHSVLRTKRSLRRQHGFTLIELTIVIIILSIIPTVVIFAVRGIRDRGSRQGNNEAQTIADMGNLATAQAVFHDQDKDHNGTQDYAPTLKMLWDAGLIDPVLATGRDHGYAFSMTTSADRLHWSVDAVPAAVNRSGSLIFHVDDISPVASDCPPGQHLDTVTGQCVPADTYITDAAVAMIHQVDVLSAGAALPAAKAIATAAPFLVQQVAAFMDMNHDGLLTFDEILNPNLLGPTWTPLLTPFTETMRRDLALGIANEQLQGTPVTAVGGDLLEILNQVPPYQPGALQPAKR